MFAYFHGFASGPRSRKARQFQSALASHGVDLHIPALDEGDFPNLTISRQLALLEKTLASQHVSLIGSSMGGYLAALYAARHPEVRRVVLLAPAFDFAPRWQARWPDSTDPATGTPRKSPSIDVFHYADLLTRPIRYSLIEDALHYPPFPDFSQPTLIFHGRNDDVVPIALSRAFVAAHPNARLVELDSDHELTDVLPAIETAAIPFLLADL